MLQVLFRIPLHTAFTPNGIPIYGFGTMLFLSFVASMWLASRRAEREGVSRERLLDLAMWVFVGGIIGARIVFMIQYKIPISDWYKFWEGGIVFYGSAVGGWIGYALAWWLSFRKYRIPTMKIADIIAPSVCVGLAIGRIGCLLNGCCYGHVCPAGGISYPLMTAPAKELVVTQGLQTTAGFGLDEAVLAMPGGPVVVGPVEPDSAAALAGLQRGDVIVSVNDQPINSPSKLQNLLLDWPRGAGNVNMEISRGGKTLPLAFTPRSLTLHPTQLYETVSMVLLFFVLIAFYPFRRHDGQVFVMLMLGYAVHRFLNETLRDDTEPVFVNLTLSQVGSLAVFTAGVVLELFLRSRSPRHSAAQPVPTQDEPGPEGNAGTVQPQVAPG